MRRVVSSSASLPEWLYREWIEWIGPARVWEAYGHADRVAALAWDRPGLALSLIALSFAIAGAITAVTTLVFLPLGIRDALSFGLTCGNRNMGLMASALITGLPHLTWVYFALGQFPIYLLPQIMRPIVRRLGADRETASPH